MNTTIMSGRAVNKAESRIVNRNGDNRKVANFRIAVPRPYKVNGEHPTDFYQVECWGNMADVAEKYVVQGKSIIVTGFVDSKPSIGKGANGQMVVYKNMTIRCQNLELGSNSFDYELARRNGQVPAEAAPAVQPAPVQAVPVQQAPVAQQAPQTAEVKVESEQFDTSEYSPALLEMCRQMLAKSKKAQTQAPTAPSIETAPKADPQQAVPIDDNDIPFDM